MPDREVWDCLRELESRGLLKTMPAPTADDPAAVGLSYVTGRGRVLMETPSWRP